MPCHATPPEMLTFLGGAAFTLGAVVAEDAAHHAARAAAETFHAGHAETKPAALPSRQPS
jgi:hypothetical protein